MKSKYAELFTAKLNDMDLVLFEKHREWESWTVAKQSDKCFMVSDNFECFLCLPQHKEACLHWLNGGEVEYTQDYKSQWFTFTGDSDREWSEESLWMRDEDIRIKPKKEKRWIAYDNGRLGVLTFHTEQGIRNQYENEESVHLQFIEIEVEV